MLGGLCVRHLQPVGRAHPDAKATEWTRRMVLTLTRALTLALTLTLTLALTLTLTRYACQLGAS